MAVEGFAGDVRTRAGWLPGSQAALEAWLEGHANRVADRGRDVELHPSVAAFADLIASDPVIQSREPIYKGFPAL